MFFSDEPGYYKVKAMILAGLLDRPKGCVRGRSRSPVPAANLRLINDFFQDGEYGIRLETILRVVKKQFPHKTFGEFIGFEPVTLVPFEPALIDFALMSPQQIEWYNAYNAKIVREISPHFAELGRSDVLDWISEKTARVDPRKSGSVQKRKKDLE